MALRVLDKLEEIIIAALMAMATTIIFVAVVHRYSLSASIDLAKWGRAHEMVWLFKAGQSVFQFLRGFNLTWAQELCIYMFVWMAKFGAAYGVRTGIHVGVDVLLVHMDAKSRYRVIMFALM